MADYLAGFYPEWVDKEENPRQIILDLGKMITNRIPVKLGFQKLNKYDPEYWGLATLLTDEQAEVALKMGVRKPKTMADMVKLTGKSEEELEKILGDMSFMGILEYNWENPTRTKQWVLPMFVPGSAEFTNMNDTILKKYALRTSQLFNTPNLSRSAYVARVEKDDCVACGKCVEVCPAGAVKLGQKLCTKDGKKKEQ